MNVWIEAPFDSLPVEGYRKQRYWLMAEAFVRAGHRVVYWTSDFSHATKGKRRLESKVDGGFELRFIPTKPYRKNVGWARVRSHRSYAREWERAATALAEQANGSPDLIVVSAPPVSTGPVAVRLARRFGARLVVDVQDAWPETFYRLLPRGFRWIAWLLLWGMRRTIGEVYRQADLVTGVCDRYEALVKGYGAKEYYRAYLGIEGLGARRWGSGLWEQEFWSRERRVRLAYVGNLGKSYDLKTVLKGVALLNREGLWTTLDVAGFGGRIKEGEFVKFHGMLGQEELRQLLERCDIGVIPMRADSFVGIPNKLAEYANAGLRIVSSLPGECESLISRYRCGATYQAGNYLSFAATVVKSIKFLPKDSRRMAEEEFAADIVYDAYCWKVCAR